MQEYCIWVLGITCKAGKRVTNDYDDDDDGYDIRNVFDLYNVHHSVGRYFSTLFGKKYVGMRYAGRNYLGISSNICIKIRR